VRWRHKKTAMERGNDGAQRERKEAAGGAAGGVPRSRGHWRPSEGLCGVSE